MFPGSLLRSVLCASGVHRFFAPVSDSSSVRGEGIAFVDDWLMLVSSLEDSC